MPSPSYDELLKFVKRVAQATTYHTGPSAVEDLLDGLQDSARELLGVPPK